MFIIEKQNPTQSQVVDSIGISTSSVNWHLTRLINYSIIAEIKEGKYKRYNLIYNPQYLIALMKNYYPSIWNIWSNRVAETFLSLSQSE